MIDRFQDETENYIPRKVIGSFILIEKREDQVHEHEYKKAS